MLTFDGLDCATSELQDIVNDTTQELAAEAGVPTSSVQVTSSCGSVVLDFSVSFSSTAAAETLVDQITNTTVTSFSQTYIDTYGSPQVQAVIGSVGPTANPTSSPTKAGEKQENTEKSDSVSVGLVAGAVVGGVVAIGLGVGFVIWHNRRKRKADEALKSLMKNKSLMTSYMSHKAAQAPVTPASASGLGPAAYSAQAIDPIRTKEVKAQSNPESLQSIDMPN